MLALIRQNISPQYAGATIPEVPSPLAGEGKGEGYSIRHPHLCPLPSRERMSLPVICARLSLAFFPPWDAPTHLSENNHGSRLALLASSCSGSMRNSYR